MQAITRMRSIAVGFGLVFAIIILGPARAIGDVIRFSTSGRFDLTSGNAGFVGVSNIVPSDTFALGTISIPSGPLAGYPGEGTFSIQFQFNNELPAITITGMIAMPGYNFDEPVLNSLVFTSATAAQLALYPDLFQRLIAHPNWLHTSSFDNGSGERVLIGASVHVEDPNEVRPIPEPSSVIAFGIALAGISWRVRRGRR